MSTKKLTQENLNTLLYACVILFLGIMFCCFGVKVLSYIIGASVIFFGVLFVVNSIARTHALLTANGLIGVALGAFGFMIIVRNLAGIILDFIPWIMISVGILIVADSFLRFFLRRDIHISVFVLEMLIGAAVVVCGLCVKLIENWTHFAAVLFGIVLIAYSLFIIFTTLFKRKK